MKYDIGISIVLGQWILGFGLLGLVIWGYSWFWNKKVVKTRKQYGDRGVESMYVLPAIAFFGSIVGLLILSAGFLASFTVSTT